TSSDALGNTSTRAYDFAVDTGTGSLVWLGHNTSTPDIDVVLRNAVTLAHAATYSRPIRILEYVGPLVNLANRDPLRTGIGLQYDYAGPLSSPTGFDTALIGCDVLLVYDQRDPSGMAAVGTEWGPALSAFLGRGGVLIVMDGNTSFPSNMDFFLQNAGVLAL